MKPYEHAEASAKVFGGKFEDYINIHRWFDQFRFAIKSPEHRLFLHHTAGVLICEQVHGDFITNSDGKNVAVRDIAEHHIVADVGEMRTPQEWLDNITDQDWVKPVKSNIEKKVQKAVESDNVSKEEPNGMDIVNMIHNAPIGDITYSEELGEGDITIIDNSDETTEDAIEDGTEAAITELKKKVSEYSSLVDQHRTFD